MCVFWNGMASEQEKKAVGFRRGDDGRLAPTCFSHARTPKPVPVISLPDGRDEYLIQKMGRRIPDCTERLRELVRAAREEKPPKEDEESVERGWLALKRKINSL